MNNKGFTLIELIVIIVIIGVIVLFALPNITSTIERQKKDAMITEIKDFKNQMDGYLINKSLYPKTTNPSDCVEKTWSEIKPEATVSPFGDKYDPESSIKVCLKSDGVGVTTYSYEIKVKTCSSTSPSCLGPGYKVDGSDYVDISVLNGDDKYTKIKKY